MLNSPDQTDQFPPQDPLTTRTLDLISILITFNIVTLIFIALTIATLILLTVHP